jgi:GNAT superfamily N-acetyltransferase
LNKNIILRPFAESDRERLREIYLLCRIQAFYWCDSTQFKLEDFEAHIIGEQIHVAMYGAVIAGFISVWAIDSFIHHLYVEPAYRAEGIGKALLSVAIANYPKPLTLKCLVKNELAINFYKKQGWEVIESGSDVLGDYYLMEYR